MITLSNATEVTLLSMSGVTTGFIAVYAVLRTWKNLRVKKSYGKYSDAGAGIANIALIVLAVSYAMSTAQHLDVDWRRLLTSASDILSQYEFILGLITALVSAGINVVFTYRRAKTRRKGTEAARHQG